MRNTRLAFALLLAALTGGCAATGAPAARATAPLPGTDACIFISSIQSWDVVDQSTLIVYAPLNKDAYLVKLFEPVPELPFKERIGFEDTTHSGQLCSDRDELLVRGDIPRRVPIVAVRRLTSDQVKRLLHPSAAPPAASG
jgi:hypothetical protein